MNKVIRRFFLNLIPFLLVAIIFFGLRFYNTFFASNTKFESEDIKLYIKPNSDFNEINSQLNSFLKSSFYFNLAAEKKGYSSRVKSGLYVIPKQYFKK
jgi:UPF0755 protein